ncbi:colicin-like bacteriocin tRNase domain-containing protein [Salmonella enterica]|uniref:colicin-like bacteriocin tRNase domain-containing protein n=1 Tax=Salmonella enterica TaxID=28901 RepID=UPI0009ABFD9A|nr:colicin-like bacteriocin tRNase domain-containing protein [Salmonella enterica]
MSDEEKSVPTDGIDYGDTMVVWPSKGNLPAGKPGGSQLSPGLSLGPGWQDWSSDGIATPQGLTVWMIPQRLTLDQTVEDGDWPGWSMMLYQGMWEQHPVSRAIEVLRQNLASGLPEPSRPAVVPFARLEPGAVLPEGISRAVTFLPLSAVTDVPATALPGEPGKITVQQRVSDMVKEGKQYLTIMGGKAMTVPVVDAKPVKDMQPGSNRFLKKTYQASVAPGLPNMVFTTNLLERPLGFPHGYQPNTDGVILEQGAYGPAGYTVASNNLDVIIRFPAESGVQPLYVSTVEFTGADELKQRQEVENNAKAAELGKAKAEADARAAAEAAARAKAEADARAAAEAVARAKAEADARAAAKAKSDAEARERERQNIESLPPELNFTPVPAYTNEMVEKAEAAMSQPGVMALPLIPRMMNLSVAGSGVVPMTPEANFLTGNTLGRAAGMLADWVVSAEAVTASVLVAVFWSPEAGKGSDQVKGRDMEALFATQPVLLKSDMSFESIRPGMGSIELPVRASLVEENGQLALRLLKTGVGGLSPVVRILESVRDSDTGLDKIIVPGLNGSRAREVIVNPSADGMPEGMFPGHGDALPHTPLNNAVSVKPEVEDTDEPLQVEDYPVPGVGQLQDFIYWQVFPDGSSYRPVYVVMTPETGNLVAEVVTVPSLNGIGVFTTQGSNIYAAQKMTVFPDEMVNRAATMLLNSAEQESEVEVATFEVNEGNELYAPAVIALSAKALTSDGYFYTSGDNEFASLNVRAILADDGGKYTLGLRKTDWQNERIPVLKAERDPVTGMDVIQVPAMAGEPPLTILINPAHVPQAPGHTGSQDLVPSGPLHTGAQVNPVPVLTVTTTPVADDVTFRDFIYWQPDAEGSGVVPVYVVLSSPYGETNAKGKYSGRDYNKDKAGGPILDLDWRTAIIDQEGVDKVKLHTARFGESAGNMVMIDRLDGILKGELQPTDTDKRFYTHEIRELERYRNLGIKDGEVPHSVLEQKAVWNNTHTATLEDYKISEKEQALYTDEALQAAYKQELKDAIGGGE